MRIKAEGDYDAIKTLVDTYGVHFDPKLRDQVVARYKALNLPPYWAGVNAEADVPALGPPKNAPVDHDQLSARRGRASTSSTARCTMPASREAASERSRHLPRRHRGRTCSSASTTPRSSSSTPTASPRCRCARRS